MDREEEFLKGFFTHVSQLSFDKAKEMVEKEKEVSNLQSTPWNLLISSLSQFTVAEKSYVELGFFANRQKSFLRKDNSLRSCYESLRSDMHKIEDVSKHNRTVLTVAVQLRQYLTARVELIEFYEKMQAFGATKPVKYSDLQGSLEELVDRHSLPFPHLAITSLNTSLSLECEALVHLVRAGTELAEWRFLPSLLLLHGAHTRMQAWEHSLNSKESWRLGSFLASPRQPPLHKWVASLKGGLSAKFALLFYNTLSQQTTQADMKALCAKLSPSIDYHYKLQSFQHKVGALAVFLVFDMFGLSDHEGPGYKLPTSSPTRLSPAQLSPAAIESPTSADPRFAQVLCLPQIANIHLIEITRLIMEKAADLSALDKVVYNFNPRDQHSTFLINFDPRFTLAVLFTGRKMEKDSVCISFLTDMASHLRGNKILAALKPGSK
ncbi:hypothetical protein B566_EDAN006658 [Ephemera danica]|nr:hypothetical protein B566_EDAN006658 [Ephemera danica]